MLPPRARTARLDRVRAPRPLACGMMRRDVGNAQSGPSRESNPSQSQQQGRLMGKAAAAAAAAAVPMPLASRPDETNNKRYARV